MALPDSSLDLRFRGLSDKRVGQTVERAELVVGAVQGPC